MAASFTLSKRSHPFKPQQWNSTVGQRPGGPPAIISLKPAGAVRAARDDGSGAVGGASQQRGSRGGDSAPGSSSASDVVHQRRGDGTGRAYAGRGRGSSAGRGSGVRGRGRGGPPAGRLGRPRGPRRQEKYDGEDGDDDDGGISEGFTVIGTADAPRASSGTAAASSSSSAARPTASAAATGAPTATAGAAAAAAAAAAAVAMHGASSSTAAPGLLAAVPSATERDDMDGSKFWAEMSGIDDVDEYDEEDEDADEDEDGEADEGQGEEGDDVQTPGEVLQNMRELGFALEEALTSATAARAAAAAPAAPAGAAAVADNGANSTSNSAKGAAVQQQQQQQRAGSDLALRDLRDTFLATMRPPGLPPWYLGPLEVVAQKPAVAGQEPAGRGFGLRTTRAVQPGELLAIALPLAVRYCRRGTTPENEDLADLMMGRSSSSSSSSSNSSNSRNAAPQDARLDQPANSFAGLTDQQSVLLGMLWRGHQPLAGGGGASRGGNSLTPTREFFEVVAGSVPAAVGASAVGKAPGQAGRRLRGGGGKGSSSPSALPEPDELYRLVNLNCLGEDFQDLALCELRGEEPLGHIALWPEAAFAGHSCAPTATAYAVGDRLVVRAVEELPKGGEVSLNWLGSLLTAPLGVRQAELRQQYGFACRCRRCTAEAKYEGGPLAALMASTYARCQELSPQLDEHIQAEDMRAVTVCRTELSELQAQLEAAVRAAQPKVNARTRRWLQASVYDLYDLTSLCADELAIAAATQSPGGQVVETEALAQCCRIVDGLAPGSDPHAYLSAEYVMRSLERFGPDHEEYRQARAGLARAFTARYGNVGSEVMELLVAARLAAEARS